MRAPIITTRDEVLTMSQVMERAFHIEATIIVKYNRRGHAVADMGIPVEVTIIADGHKLTEVVAYGLFNHDQYHYNKVVLDDPEFLPTYIWRMLDGFEAGLRSKRVEKASDDISL